MFFLGMAFLSVWLLVTLYLIYVGLRQRHIDTEIQLLREEIEAAERK